MRIKWITLLAISLIVAGCAPTTHIQNTYLQMDQPNTGEVEIFNSFDEIEGAYKKVAELQVSDTRPLNEKTRKRMIDSLKSVAQRLGAEGIVVLKEQETVTVESLPASGGETNVYQSFIKGMAVVYK